MKIEPLNFNIFKPSLRVNNRDRVQYPPTYTYASIGTDTVSFKASVPYEIQTLKRLLAYKIPDIYIPGG